MWLKSPGFGHTVTPNRCCAKFQYCSDVTVTRARSPLPWGPATIARVVSSSGLGEQRRGGGLRLVQRPEVVQLAKVTLPDQRGPLLPCSPFGRQRNFEPSLFVSVFLVISFQRHYTHESSKTQAETEKGNMWLMVVKGHASGRGGGGVGMEAGWGKR